MPPAPGRPGAPRRRTSSGNLFEIRNAMTTANSATPSTSAANDQRARLQAAGHLGLARHAVHHVRADRPTPMPAPTTARPAPMPAPIMRPGTRVLLGVRRGLEKRIKHLNSPK